MAFVRTIFHMPIFQFKCESCSAVFEHLIGVAVGFSAVNCLSCGSEGISRVEKTYFYPNKTFCPHDKQLDSEKLRVQLGGILVNTEQRCGGCGTDGAPGKCPSGGGGGGCGGGCSCKKGKSCEKPLNLDIYEKKSF